ncbi:hypothetical protein chiPu_0017398 [Chiloscyllium punctatum]|uniref:Uncharacterized protein n=1 Tax=Chiloscyllium punctatum TaxID=137246 RepID=A0A401RFS6_CHIPU|nr:hypothetical protein [Chiloscyllium punctatum]
MDGLGIGIGRMEPGKRGDEKARAQQQLQLVSSLALEVRLRPSGQHSHDTFPDHLHSGVMICKALDPSEGHATINNQKDATKYFIHPP